MTRRLTTQVVVGKTPTTDLLAPERAATAAAPAPSLPDRATRLKSLAFSAFFVALLSLVVLFAIPPRYETNDDPGMNGIVAGQGVVDHPDEHLVYSNVIVGLVLKQLYQSAPNIPWYGIYLFVGAAIGLTAICYVLTQRDLSHRNMLLSAAFITIFGLPYLTALQFTRVAFLLSLAGLLLLLSALRPAIPRLQLWAAIPFLIVGALIRLDAVPLSWIVVSPGLLLLVWTARRESASRLALFILLGTLATQFGLSQFNSWYYERDPEWRGFYAFDELRAEFTDYDRARYDESTAPLFDSVGWRDVDLDMLKSWCFLDADRFNAETMRFVLEGAAEQHLTRPPPPLAGLWQTLTSNTELIALWICGIAFLIFLKVDRRALGIALTSFAMAALLCVFLYETLHLPPRVFCPAFAGFVVLTLFFSSGVRQFGVKRFGPTPAAFVTLGFAMILVAVLVNRVTATSNANASFHEYTKRVQRMMRRLDPKPTELYVTWGSSFPDECFVLPFARNIDMERFKEISLGWTTQTPFTKARLQAFGLTDLHSMLERRGEVYFISNSTQNGMLHEYLRVHYDEQLGCRAKSREFQFGDVGVYSMKCKSSKDRSKSVPGSQRKHRGRRKFKNSYPLGRSAIVVPRNPDHQCKRHAQPQDALLQSL